MTWQELGQHHLLVYSTAWCPDCRRLKRVLQSQGVRFTEVDIDTDQGAAARLQAQTQRTAIPFVQLDDGPMVRGWHDDCPGRFSDAIFLHESEVALKAVGKA